MIRNSDFVKCEYSNLVGDGIHVKKWKVLNIWLSSNIVDGSRIRTALDVGGVVADGSTDKDDTKRNPRSVTQEVAVIVECNARAMLGSKHEMK